MAMLKGNGNKTVEAEVHNGESWFTIHGLQECWTGPYPFSFKQRSFVDAKKQDVMLLLEQILKFSVDLDLFHMFRRDTEI